ncbi:MULTISPECIES: putative motility protein [Clostridium]|uniref:putative motility protein n=1 Tax=Clostridium TaxID=1485 RepID=UPI0009F55086|nr:MULTISPECIES: putative motility protein [Clostridium]
MAISQSTLALSVQLSVMKLQMNMGEEMLGGMTDMLENMVVDSSKGVNLDVRV